MTFRPNWYDDGRCGRDAVWSDMRRWSAFRTILTLNLVAFAAQLLVVSFTGAPWLDALGSLRARFPDGTFNWFFLPQLLTSPWLHADPGHLFWNMYALWLFGPELEAQIGRRGFWRLYLGGALLGGLAQWAFFLGNGLVAGGLGASGAVMAVMVLFSFRNPNSLFLLFFALPVPAWLLTVFYVMGDIAGAIGPPDGVGHMAHLGGAAFGLGCWLARGRLARWVRQRREAMMGGAHRPEVLDRREMDRILAKIQATGLGSLLATERAFLQRRSEQLRARRR